MAIQISPVIPAQATQEELEAFTRISNLRDAIIMPDDPPTPVEANRRMFANIPPVVRVFGWLAMVESGVPVGYSTCELIDIEENRHMAQGRLFVDPAYRRQGIGSRLLAQVYQRLCLDNRRVYITEATDRDPAGLEFARRVGGEVGLAMHINQFELANVNRDLLEEWQRRAGERASDYELVFWDGAYPEAELGQIAAMMESMNEAPTGELDMEDMHMTPELLRQIESSLFGRGSGRWTFVARHKPSCTIAGYTEITWPATKPAVGIQGGTGVLSAHRNHGLGRWLKASMLQKVLDERSQTRFIRTANADMNEPMLKINQELGFLPFVANSICQVTTENLSGYLREKGLA